MIPDSFKQDVLSRVPIVDVISSSVQLQKRGREYVGLCPFHEEKTPSFKVNPSKGFFHCFGCAQHGNALEFLMAYEGRGFRDAMAKLAAMAGLQLPDSGPTDPARVKADQDAAIARSMLDALEPEMHIAVVAVADAINGVKPSDEDRERFAICVKRILRGIEFARRQPLTDAVRRRILGDEQSQQQ